MLPLRGGRDYLPPPHPRVIRPLLVEAGRLEAVAAASPLAAAVTRMRGTPASPALFLRRVAENR